jgi:hypothetical protein
MQINHASAFTAFKSAMCNAGFRDDGGKAFGEYGIPLMQGSRVVMAAWCYPPAVGDANGLSKVVIRAAVRGGTKQDSFYFDNDASLAEALIAAQNYACSSVEGVPSPDEPCPFVGQTDVRETAASTGVTGAKRRPFKVTEDGLFVNGRIDFDVKVHPSLDDSMRQEAQKATNDRFESWLTWSESKFGPVDDRKYRLLVESFIDNVVKPVCKVEMPGADALSNERTAIAAMDDSPSP